jgi:espin
VKRWVHSTNKDVDARSDENLTALHYAARGGHSECVRLLVAAGADPNVQDERRITPLHFAVVGGHALCVKLLLDHHADPFREDLDQQTALSLAEKSGNIGCARLLQRAMAKAAVVDDVSLQDSSLTLRAGSSRVDNAV